MHVTLCDCRQFGVEARDGAGAGAGTNAGVGLGFQEIFTAAALLVW